MPWEYQIIRTDQYMNVHESKRDTSDLQEKLNVLGADGWELVSLVGEINIASGTSGFAAVLKRPKG
jgi:hypothetical protein